MVLVVQTSTEGNWNFSIPAGCWLSMFQGPSEIDPDIANAQQRRPQVGAALLQVLQRRLQGAVVDGLLEATHSVPFGA